MKTFLSLFLACVICTGGPTLLVSCSGKADTYETVSEQTEVVKAPLSYPTVQTILDTLYDKVTLKDGRIYLSFGARDTLTVENFNKLILQDQLGYGNGRFTFVIEPSSLEALKSNYAYGGIGFDQEWITSLNVQIKDISNGAISEPIILVMTLLKSREMDKILKGAQTSAAIPKPIEY